MCLVPCNDHIKDDGLIGLTDTEYIIASKITISKAALQDARGAYSKGSQTSQQGSRKVFLRK